MRVFICPSDSRVSSAAELPGKAPAGLTSYVGVNGRSHYADDGLFYSDSAVRFADVLDGTSMTLLIGERPPSSDLAFGWWYAGIGQDQLGSADLFLGVEEVNVSTRYNFCWRGPYSFGPGSFDNPCDVFHFWSPHNGGTHFALVDGSVQFVRYSAEPVLAAMSTRAGGETVTRHD